jgi:hypothetical protein
MLRCLFNIAHWLIFLMQHIIDGEKAVTVFLMALRKRLDATVQEDGAQQIVIIPVQFEKDAVDFTITLNSSREVARLFIRPVEQAKAELAA